MSRVPAHVDADEAPIRHGFKTMRFSGRQIGLLKEYMHDLVEQAKQEEAVTALFGYASTPYRADQAMSDLLAIVDDRVESEGVQVGLSVDFLHHVWTLCDEADARVRDTVWFIRNVEGTPATKARVRALTYQALIEYAEHHDDPPATSSGHR